MQAFKVTSKTSKNPQIFIRRNTTKSEAGHSMLEQYCLKAFKRCNGDEIGDTNCVGY